MCATELRKDAFQPNSELALRTRISEVGEREHPLRGFGTIGGRNCIANQLRNPLEHGDNGRGFVLGNQL